MIKSGEKKTPQKSKKKSKVKFQPIIEKSEEKVDEKEIDAESKFYKIGDEIDCIDASISSWFEAKILKILKKGNDLLYKVQWDSSDAADDIDPFNIEENKIRPRAWKILSFDDLKVGQKVMLNHNLEEPGEVGNWYDFTISKIKITKIAKKLQGTLHIGNDTELLKNYTIEVTGDIYDIEKPIPLNERNDQLIKSRVSLDRRILPAKCNYCKDNPKKICKECNCRICGKKKDPHLTLLCDECDDAYHLACLKPRLKKLPEDDWYCPKCKRNENEVIKIGEKIKSKKTGRSTRDWGNGFATVGRTKTCSIVPTDHRGPIPGIDVGTTWKFRIQVSEAGVHRPHVAGISGRSQDCAYSIVLSGGYEDDVDEGEKFLYTGAGGRDLSGNKRTAEQSCDQTLTATNLALARNCNAPVNDTDGNEAKDWKKGIPVRVVRNYKLSKHSVYAPKEGNRYDGIYKVVKYWRETGMSGFKIWRYLLKRDDPSPAPWTEDGKKMTESLGLKMLYPEGYLEAQEKKLSAQNSDTKVTEKKSLEGKKRKLTNQSDDKLDEKETPTTKKSKSAYVLSKDVKKLIEEDESNIRLWNICDEALINGKQEYLEKVSTEFACVVCQDLVINPNTTPCSHNICLSCLQRSFACDIFECPMCRTSLKKNYDMKVNEKLRDILAKLFPGYDKR